MERASSPSRRVRSTRLSNMFSCCAMVLAYVTQKPAVCYVSMSLPVQQFVLHIPRHHRIVRGMMLIGLKVWKSPLFYPWGSLSKTHTFMYTCTCAWRKQHQQTHDPMKSWSGKKRKQSPKVPYSCCCSHHTANVYHFLTASCSAWHRYKWLFTCCSNHLLNISCDCRQTGKCYLCDMFLNYYCPPTKKINKKVIHLVVNRMCCQCPPWLHPNQPKVIWLPVTQFRIFYKLKTQLHWIIPQKDRTNLISQTSRHAGLTEHCAPAV